MYEYHFIETSNLVDKREICAEPIVRAKNSFTDNAPYIAARSEPPPHSRLQHEDHRAVVAGLADFGKIDDACGAAAHQRLQGR